MPRLAIPDLANNTLSENLGAELQSRFDALEASENDALHFRGAWTNVLDVRAHDAVLSGGILWEALVDSVNLTPAAGASWRQVLTGVNGLTQSTKTTSYTVVGGEDRIDLDSASGGTITLPAASAALWKKARLTICNIADSGTWSVTLSGSETWPGGGSSISLPPGNSLETYVAQRAGGTTYRWAKV